MAKIETHLVPDEYYSAKDVQRLMSAMEKILQAKEVMHVKEAAAFLGISVSKLYRSKFPFHHVEGLEGRLFLRSELIEFIKKHSNIKSK